MFNNSANAEHSTTVCHAEARGICTILPYTQKFEMQPVAMMHVLRTSIKKVTVKKHSLKREKAEVNSIKNIFCKNENGLDK